MNIELKYDGKYPNLCAGTLIATINGKIWQFEPHALRSCGGVWFDKDWNEHVDEGDWHIDDWPENFPEEQKAALLEAVNLKIPHGCCGGCV